LPFILNDFDSIERGEDDKIGNARFLISKELEGKAYLVTIQRGKYKLEIKTFYKKKSGA
jgi:hypothetical protein